MGGKGKDNKGKGKGKDKKGKEDKGKGKDKKGKANDKGKGKDKEKIREMHYAAQYYFMDVDRSRNVTLEELEQARAKLEADTDLMSGPHRVLKDYLKEGAPAFFKRGDLDEDGNMTMDEFKRVMPWPP